jgi:hypothetical protein
MTFPAKELRLNSATSMSIAQELRTVGQGLESLDVGDFDLQGQDNGYFALGIRRTGGPRADMERPAKAFALSLLQNVWQSLTGRKSSDSKFFNPGPDVLRILFTPEGLLRLEAAGIARRNAHSTGIPDSTRLGQILRMVGEGLDAKSGRMLKVGKRRDRISFEYATADNQHATEEWKISELAERWREAFQLRQ